MDQLRRYAKFDDEHTFPCQAARIAAFMKINSLIPFLAVAAALLPAVLSAQEAVNSPEAYELAQASGGESPALRKPAGTPARTSFELYSSGHRLSGAYGDWRELGARGSYESGAHRWQVELASMRRFSQSGKYVGISDTITIDEDWFATFSAGAGDGAFYMPRYRLDGFINRKFLPGRNLVGTLGTGYYNAPDGHIDRNLSVGATYYFTGPWVVQGEVRFNNSSPGDIWTRQQFIAATWGRAGKTQVTGRHAWGSEGYQTIAQAASLVNFRSRETSLKVRQWLGPAWGLEAGVQRYQNPFYARYGASIAIFAQFE